MSDFATNLPQIVAGAGADDRINELFDAASPATIFGRNAATTLGLTWGFLGGRWSGILIANGTLALTASATNYVVVELLTGVVSVSTSNTHWNDTTNYARAYQVITGVAGITDHQDDRGGLYGTQNAAASGNSTLGKHAVFVTSGAMQPSVTGGCAALTSLASGGEPARHRHARLRSDDAGVRAVRHRHAQELERGDDHRKVHLEPRDHG
jgi:hypothetical protein